MEFKNKINKYFHEIHSIDWQKYYLWEDDKLYRIGNEIINSLIIPENNLGSKYKKIIDSDEYTKKKFIQSIYSLDDIDEFNDLRFTSLLFYMLKYTKLNETKLYVMDILTKVYNAISFNILFFYSHTPYDKKIDKRFTFYKKQRNLDSIGYFDLDNFTDFCKFDSPKFYDQALKILDFRLDNTDSIYRLHYYDRLFTYLSF